MVQPLLRTILFFSSSMFHLSCIHTIVQLKAFQLGEFLVLYQLKFSFNTSKNMTLCRISVGLLKKSLVPLLIMSFLMINNLVCILGNVEVDCRRMADLSGAVYLSSSVQRYSDGDYTSSTCSGSYKSGGVYQSVWQAIRGVILVTVLLPPPPLTACGQGRIPPLDFLRRPGSKSSGCWPKGNVLFARLSVGVSTCCMWSTTIQGGGKFTSTPFHTP